MPSQEDAEVARNFIATHRLVPHPEGGFYTVTYVSDVQVASPFAKEHAQRPLASTIYYLLAPQSVKADDVKGLAGDAATEVPRKHRTHSGYFHTNASTTNHTWHSGRAVYTLIKKKDPQSGEVVRPEDVEVKTVVIGPDAAKGEQMCLIVEGGWWKRSELVEPEGHCLISECVMPAWVPEDHEFMTEKHLEELFGDRKDLIEKYKEHTLDDGPIFG